MFDNDVRLHTTAEFTRLALPKGTIDLLSSLCHKTHKKQSLTKSNHNTNSLIFNTFTYFKLVNNKKKSRKTHWTLTIQSFHQQNGVKLKRPLYESKDANTSFCERDKHNRGSFYTVIPRSENEMTDDFQQNFVL